MKKILIINGSKRRNGNSQMVETNLKSFATAGFRDYKAHVAGNANVPGSIMEKPDDLKAADEMVAWLLA
jgi:hypothetical protein